MLVVGRGNKMNELVLLKDILRVLLPTVGIDLLNGSVKKI
jgi:hypothetical protein